MCNQITFYFWTKTYVVGTQKKHLITRLNETVLKFEHPKHMFKYEWGKNHRKKMMFHSNSLPFWIYICCSNKKFIIKNINFILCVKYINLNKIYNNLRKYHLNITDITWTSQISLEHHRISFDHHRISFEKSQTQVKTHRVGAFCNILTFINLPFVTKTFVLSIFERPFYTGFTVMFFLIYLNPWHAEYFVCWSVLRFSPIFIH